MIDSPAELPDEAINHRNPGTLDEHRNIYSDGFLWRGDGTGRSAAEELSWDRNIPPQTESNSIIEIPLSELIVDFFDQLKSHTRGYASMDYQFLEYRVDELVKLEILVNDEPVDALATIVHKNEAYHKGQAIITKLKDLIPAQLFVVPIQAYADGRVISRANVKALRKDVLAKCYGGDISRKKKLLEKQKKGKKRMKMVGNVEIPQEAFLAVLRVTED